MYTLSLSSALVFTFVCARSRVQSTLATLAENARVAAVWPKRHDRSILVYIPARVYLLSFARASHPSAKDMRTHDEHPDGVKSSNRAAITK